MTDQELRDYYIRRILETQPKYVSGRTCARLLGLNQQTVAAWLRKGTIKNRIVSPAKNGNGFIREIAIEEVNRLAETAKCRDYYNALSAKEAK